MLTVHHLQRSQSDRIVFLCEELGLNYNLKLYQRDPKTILGPAELKALHPAGAAPVIQDAGITLAESGAIVDYILSKYDGARLTVGPSEPAYTDYLYWLHFANGNLQPQVSRLMMLRFAGVGDSNPVYRGMRGRLDAALKRIDERVAANAWLAGAKFTAADVMLVTSLTTMRCFYAYSLADYKGILGYLRRIGEREAYRRATAKADPGFEPPLGADPPEQIRPNM